MPNLNTKPVLKEEAAAAFAKAFGRDERILVAVSGGPDSMALLALLVEWMGATLHAVTVDHGLRQESLLEAKAVAETCRKIGVPHTILSWKGDKPSSGLQQAARDTRYAMLCDFARAENFTCMTTAHHANDQAETVLMRLTSGSGISGLAGMKVEGERFETNSNEMVAAVRHIRPLLRFSKAQLINSCKARGVSFVNDPSNENPSFERVRVRRIMESLAIDGLSQERLLRLADRAAIADEALEHAAENFFSSQPIGPDPEYAVINWNQLCKEPKAIRQRVITKILKSVSQASFVEKLERMEFLIDEIDAFYKDGKSLKRSIGHWIINLSRSGKMIIKAAPQRQRGKKR